MNGRDQVIRVALADRESLLAHALSHLVEAEADMIVSGIYNDGESLLNGLGKSKAEIVLMDPMGLTSMGMEIVRQVLGSYPEAHIVILTANQQEQQLFAAVARAPAATSRRVQIFRRSWTRFAPWHMEKR